jgi:hypothetical protein
MAPRRGQVIEQLLLEGMPAVTEIIPATVFLVAMQECGATGPAIERQAR